MVKRYAQLQKVTKTQWLSVIRAIIAHMQMTTYQLGDLVFLSARQTFALVAYHIKHTNSNREIVFKTPEIYILLYKMTMKTYLKPFSTTTTQT